MRPKQIAKSGEKPTLALQRRGVLYVEMRSLDLNLFEPLGISETTARFIEAFLLSCLLQDSPKQTAADFQINNQNQLTVANQGRKPGVLLNRQGESVSLQHWAQDILQAMQPVCALLDENLPEPVYSQALELQMALVNNPDLTPSAQILAGMRNNSEEFGCFAMHMSAAHERQFRAERPSDDCLAYFQQQATQSIEKQQAIEAADSVSFDAFLADYFAQTL